jgi:hypothetical protein
MGGFPLFTTHLRAKIWAKTSFWGSKGGSAPLKEKTARMECCTFFWPHFLAPIFSSHIDPRMTLRFK